MFSVLNTHTNTHSKGTKENLEVMNIFTFLIAVMVKWVYINVQTHKLYVFLNAVLLDTNYTAINLGGGGRKERKQSKQRRPCSFFFQLAGMQIAWLRFK